jgi:hypothetical protein
MKWNTSTSAEDSAVNQHPTLGQVGVNLDPGEVPEYTFIVSKDGLNIFPDTTSGPYTTSDFTAVFSNNPVPSGGASGRVWIAGPLSDGKSALHLTPWAGNPTNRGLVVEHDNVLKVGKIGDDVSTIGLYIPCGVASTLNRVQLIPTNLRGLQIQGEAGLAGSANVLGQIAVNSLDSTLNFYDGTAWRFVPATQTNVSDALLGTSGTPTNLNRFVTNDDSRMTDSRTPTGAASGDLAGTYPSPSVAAITTTSGPTSLTIGAIPDTFYLQRSGTSIIGVAPSAIAGVFGDNYQKAEVVGPFTTTGVTYIDVTSITTPTLTGTFRLTLSWAFANTSKLQYLRLYDDNLSATIGQESVVKINTNNSIWSFSKTHIVTLSAESKLYKVQIKTEDAGNPADIRDVLLEWWRVS